ncbi:MAG: YSC84-related protein [Candidatus Methylomirabilales bacterium]
MANKTHHTTYRRDSSTAEEGRIMSKGIGIFGIAIICALVGATVMSPRLAVAATAAELDRDASAALTRLYANTPTTKELAAIAKGILVFPNVVKAGFLVGGLYGEGVLLKGGKPVAYYNTVAASYGYQAGVQTYGYALFFMNDGALQYLDRSDGWELGTGPSIVVVDQGVAGGLSTTSARADVYDFIFDQKGLMAGLGLQGSKITKIDK